MRLPEACCSPVLSTRESPGLFVTLPVSPPCYLPQGLCAGWCPALGPLFRSLESESLGQDNSPHLALLSGQLASAGGGGEGKGRREDRPAEGAQGSPDTSTTGEGTGVSGTLVGTREQSWGPPPSSTPVCIPVCTRPSPSATVPGSDRRTPRPRGQSPASALGQRGGGGGRGARGSGSG